MCQTSTRQIEPSTSSSSRVVVVASWRQARAAEADGAAADRLLGGRLGLDRARPAAARIHTLKSTRSVTPVRQPGGSPR
jgi:hypothetical protein